MTIFSIILAWIMRARNTRGFSEGRRAAAYAYRRKVKDIKLQSDLDRAQDKAEADSIINSLRKDIREAAAEHSATLSVKLQEFTEKNKAVEKREKAALKKAEEAEAKYGKLYHQMETLFNGAERFAQDIRRSQRHIKETVGDGVLRKTHAEAAANDSLYLVKN